MSKESRGEFAGWAGKLEAPGALPDEGLTDREAAWDQLYRRLQKDQQAARTPRRTAVALSAIRTVGASFGSSRWAAACLIFLLGAVGTILLFRRRQAIRETVALQQSTKPATDAAPGILPRTNPTLLRVQTATGSLSSRSWSPEVLPQSSIPGPGDLSVRKSPVFTRPHPWAGAAKKIFPKTAAIPKNIPSPADSLTVDLPALATVQAARKKELKVVTLNDVTDPPAEDNLAAYKEQHIKHRFKIGYPVEIRPAMASQQTDQPRFIIRLSSPKP